MTATSLTANALRIIDAGDVPHFSHRSKVQAPAVIYDALVAECNAVAAARAMCTDALKSRSPKEAALALSLLAVLDDVPVQVAS